MFSSICRSFLPFYKYRSIIFVLYRHLQRDFGDKRVFSERRRNDSYAEEEPEWFSGGPTSQSETIELIGFDDKILEDDKRKSKRSRKRTESVKEGMSKLHEIVPLNYSSIIHFSFLH